MAGRMHASAVVAVCLVAWLLASLGRAQAGTVTLRGITAWPENSVENAGFFYFRDRLAEASGGSLRIDYVGGPEAFPTYEQIEALRLGIVDVALLSASYTTSIVPEAHFFRLSRLSPEEERSRGVFDAFNEAFVQRANAVYIGRAIPGVAFHMWLTRPVRTVADFRGLRIRVSPNYLTFVRALGATPVTMAPTDVYSALERGVVDGTGWPAHALTDWNWQEFIRYRVDPGFYQVDTIILMSRQAWERLSEEARQAIREVARAMERDMAVFYRKEVERELGRLREAGVEIIQLPDDEAARYVELAYSSEWDNLLRQMPQSGPRFATLLAGR